jgi:hypothetical protein
MNLTILRDVQYFSLPTVFSETAKAVSVAAMSSGFLPFRLDFRECCFFPFPVCADGARLMADYQPGDLLGLRRFSEG